MWCLLRCQTSGTWISANAEPLFRLRVSHELLDAKGQKEAEDRVQRDARLLYREHSLLYVFRTWYFVLYHPFGFWLLSETCRAPVCSTVQDRKVSMSSAPSGKCSQTTSRQQLGVGVGVHGREFLQGG